MHRADKRVEAGKSRVSEGSLEGSQACVSLWFCATVVWVCMCVLLAHAAVLLCDAWAACVCVSVRLYMCGTAGVQ